MFLPINFWLVRKDSGKRCTLFYRIYLFIFQPLLIFDNYDSLCSILECEQPTRSTTEEARSGQTTKKRKLNDDATESKAFGPVEYNELLNGILTASIADNDCYHKVLLAGHYTISLSPNLTKSITNYDFVNDIKPLTSQIGFNEADFEASCKHYKIDESDRKRVSYFNKIELSINTSEVFNTRFK